MKVEQLYQDFKKLQSIIQQSKKKDKSKYQTQKKKKDKRSKLKQKQFLSIDQCLLEYNNSMKKLNKINKYESPQKQSVSIEHLKEVKTNLFQKEVGSDNIQRESPYSQNEEKNLLKIKQGEFSNQNQGSSNMIKEQQNILSLFASQFADTCVNLQEKFNINLQKQVDKLQTIIKNINQLTIAAIKKSPKIKQISQSEKDQLKHHNQYFSTLQEKIQKLELKIENLERNAKRIQKNKFQLNQQLKNYKQTLKHKQETIISLNLQISSLNMQIASNFLQKQNLTNEGHLSHQKSFQHTNQQKQDVKLSNNELDQINKNFKNLQNLKKETGILQFADYKSQIGGSDISSIKGENENLEQDFELQKNYNDFKQLNRDNPSNGQNDVNQKGQNKQQLNISDFNDEFVEGESVDSQYQN